MTDWTGDDLARIDDAQELRIATLRADGTWRAAVPIWAVVADGRVYVRTWYRRDDGWYGRAVRDGRARIAVPGVETDVRVVACGVLPGPREPVDEAYRRKYGAGVERMIGDEAAATTLRLDPES